jgi:pimeloyl-CoA dehydrogenase
MAELGLLGLPFDPELGGSGQSAIELMLVAQELGRSLGGGRGCRASCWPANCWPKRARRRNAVRWLPALASGELRLALAFGEADSRYDLGACCHYRSHGERRLPNRWRKTLVLDGDTADVFLVVARSAGATD